MASEEASTSGRLLSPAVSERLLWAALAAAAVPLIGAVWWLCETGLNSLAPPQVLYSPCHYPAAAREACAGTRSAPALLRVADKLGALRAVPISARHNIRVRCQPARATRQAAQTCAPCLSLTVSA